MKKTFIFFCIFLLSQTFSTMASIAVTSNAQLSLTAAESNMSGIEIKMFNQVNKKRAAFGLRPLKPVDYIQVLARKHSKKMAAGKVPFGHAGFDSRADKIFASGNYSYVAENVGFTTSRNDPVTIIVNAWMNSPEHRQTILGNFQKTGVGIAFSSNGSCYATQIFARKG